DTDGDGVPDFVDTDSDDDGLLDSVEDANRNGAVDAGETDARKTDTDGDGASDLVEVAAATDPTNKGDNPHARGDFVFLVPYEQDQSPLTDTLSFSTKITHADVVFLMDTTSSMGEEITNLKDSLKNIFTELKVIPSIGFGVAAYDDFPMSPYGGNEDTPFYLLHRVSTVAGNGEKSVNTAVSSLKTHWGDDWPESGWQAMHEIATGKGLTYSKPDLTKGTIPAFDPAKAKPAPEGEELGGIGGVGFRAGALPIIVWMTDAPNHNSEGFPYWNYGVSANPFFPAPAINGAAKRSEAIEDLKRIGAKLIGVFSNEDPSLECKTDGGEAISATGSTVVPEAFGGDAASRPAGCAVGKCCTGIDDAGVNSVAGKCPLGFVVSKNGSGLGESIINAIKVLTTFGTMDITAKAFDGDSTDQVDPIAAFIDRIEANANAAAPCSSGLTAIDSDGKDGPDTFTGTMPGSTVCFNVVSKKNTTVVGKAEPQMFMATIKVYGGVAELDQRNVYFLVPPYIPPPQVQ
ncbi:MAG: VWA domain-containing protein, partial [Pseudomonadota bacterium]